MIFLLSKPSATAHYDQVFTHLIERYIPLEPALPKIQGTDIDYLGGRGS
jgi:hypothetical protein